MLLAAILVFAMAAPVGAGVIYDVQTGVYEDGQDVPDVVGVVVTYVGVNSSDHLIFWCSEAPSGEYRAIFIRTDYDPSALSLEVGDVVTVSGASVWEAVPGWPNLDISSGQGDSVAVTGAAEIPWFDILYQEFRERPGRAWTYCPIHLTEGFTVTSAMSSYWEASSVASGLTAYFTLFDDYPIWFSVDDCYQGVRGLSDNSHHLYVYPDGLQIISCSLPTQAMSFGAVKSMYR